MPKNKPLPEVLLSKLHGKGTMSEILDIERSRLLEQSEQDMKRQLGPADSARAAPLQPAPQPNPTPAIGPSLAPPPRESSWPHQKQTPSPQAGLGAPASFEEPATAGLVNAGVRNLLPLALDAEARIYRTPTSGDPVPPEPAASFSSAVEGFSRLSRVVGDDLSEFGTIFRHSPATASQQQPHILPKPCQDYYTQIVDSSLPFTGQRNLLAAIRRLTLGWGTLSCQITLELLANVSGIRNIKTVRKWLADLHNKRHIRYTPVHGDLRGSVITLTPPPGLHAAIEQWRRERAPEGGSNLPGMPLHGGGFSDT